ncbi:hypothetical protein ACFYV7_02990 [Nocardia suismassiliense]|uniref:Uncharacterized protein n=1 Tax=Nocardia suismassiliense TaxID=2077092 RepID=A0ABW6QKW1_9NOCA
MGVLVSAMGTVPFCLWIVAHIQGIFREARWATAVTGGVLTLPAPLSAGSSLRAWEFLAARRLARSL